MRDAAQALIESNVVDGLRWNAERRPMAVPSFQIDVSPVDENATIGEVLDKWVPLVTSLVSQLERDLTARARPDSLVALFDFPLEVRTPCEQYLLYFIEFLRDVGVEAQADLSHDAGRVLFSVTPTHGQEALGQIREALTAYLELPAAAELDITSIEADPRVQQLVANIQHLKGQLYIASAALQLKDATIAQLSIQRTSRSDLLLTGAVIPESLRAIDTSRPEEDCEEVIPGIVKLTEYSAKGVSINLAELYRRLRRRLLGPGDSGDHGSSTAT